MRIPIAIFFAATLALSPAPAMAQAYNDTANAADTAAPAPEADANLTAVVPPTDSNMVATTEAPPAADIAMTNDADAAAATGRRPQRMPWGLLGLLGLVGLLGRRRAER